MDHYDSRSQYRINILRAIQWISDEKEGMKWWKKNENLKENKWSDKTTLDIEL